MDNICAERTDRSIRQALDNLPKTLSKTFRRTLEQSKQKGHCYQKNILKILVGANRPLTTAEFQEALSVIPGDITWDPGNLINNIHATLACCGSLVIVDEEERTVRLLHRSVTQFLHNKTSQSAEWHFSEQDANIHMGDITMTYLNYPIFEQRVSTRVVPQVYAERAPERIATHVLKPFGTVGKLASKALKTHRSSNRDIGLTLFEASNSGRSSKPMLENFGLLEYSSENWLIHTCHINDDSPMVHLCKRLLHHPRFSNLPWTRDEESSNASTVDQESGTVLRIPPRIRWAMLHSHSLLFSMELRGRSGIKALCSVVPYLKSLMETNILLKLGSGLCDKLLLITTFFRVAQPTDWLIKMHNCSFERYLQLLKDVDGWGYDTFRWAVGRDFSGDLYDVLEPLVEEAVKNCDPQTVKLLLKKGAKLDAFTFEPPLQSAMRSCFCNPENLLMVSHMLRRAEVTDIATLALPDVFNYLYTFSRFAKMDRTLGLTFDQEPSFVDTLKSERLKMDILLRACERGHDGLVRLLSSSGLIIHDLPGWNAPVAEQRHLDT